MIPTWVVFVAFSHPKEWTHPCISCPFSDHRCHPERKLLPLHEPQLWAKLWDPKGKMLDVSSSSSLCRAHSETFPFFILGVFVAVASVTWKLLDFNQAGALPGFKLPSAVSPRIGVSRECKPGVEAGITPGIFSPQWTVNGQLRVGFFTTKPVPSGSELTFDYQFQRYGYVPFPGPAIPALPPSHCHCSCSIPFPENSLPCFFLSDC